MCVQNNTMILISPQNRSIDYADFRATAFEILTDIGMPRRVLILGEDDFAQRFVNIFNNLEVESFKLNEKEYGNGANRIRLDAMTGLSDYAVIIRPDNGDDFTLTYVKTLMEGRAITKKL